MYLYVSKKKLRCILFISECILSIFTPDTCRVSASIPCLNSFRYELNTYRFFRLRRFLPPISVRLYRHLRDCIAVAMPCVTVASPWHRRGIAASHRRCIASLHETQPTCQLHWNYIFQWCGRLVARGLKMWSLSSGLWAKN
jgi:hypothetical protein